ncbi:MAG: carbohydrate ABC transporter permease, partial [Saccharofermentanales bacterium]
IFPSALKNTLVFAFFIGPIGFFASFFMAVSLNNMKFKNVYALAFYAPSITSGIAMTVIWMYFFSNDSYGLVNNILLNLGIVGKPMLWSRDPALIFPIVVLISVWMSMGTGFLVFLAGLQALPAEIYEQSKIDGISNPVQELRFITIPMMKPQLLFGSINAIVGSFGVFDVAMQFAGFPSPNYAAHTIVAHAYDYAFVRFEFGYSSAISVILFVMILSLGRVFIRLFRSE